MPTKKIIVALLIIAVAVGGFVAGLMLLNEQQDLREEASTTTGTATVSVDPETATLNVGDTFDVKVYFDPKNVVINGVAVRLLYPFSGSSPEVTVNSIEVSQSISSSGDWTCPTQDSSLSGENVVIDIACANTSSAGFTSDENVLLANISLNVTRTPQVSPFVVRFDNVNSVIYRKSDNQDILLVPASIGSYTIAGATQPTLTPTAGLIQTVTPTSSLTTTLTPTIKLTGTVTPTLKATATPTSSISKGGELPDAGVSLPTILGISFGILVIAGAVFLAL